MVMTPGRIALLLAVAALAGCYRPNIQDAGLVCPGGADGGVCPEGYRCGSDRRCHKGAKPMCLPDAGVVAPLCADQPLGDQCDPICQQGCECGRCNVVGDKLQCVAVGSKVAGDFCSLSSDDCAAGLVCLREPCSAESPDAGTQLGRCYRYCAGDQHCDGTSCNVPINSPVASVMRACQLPPRTCDPVTATTTCGSPLLGCYVESNGRLSCDCPGPAGRDEPCDFLTDCAPGFRCVREGGAATPRCRKVCRLTGSDCMSGSCAGTPGDSMFGYCTP